MFKAVMELAISVVVQLAGPIILNPFVAIPAATVVSLGLLVAKVYLKAQLSIKREQRCARDTPIFQSPPFSQLHFVASPRHLFFPISVQLLLALVRVFQLHYIGQS